MDSCKSYINREPTTLVGRSVVVRLDRDWLFDGQASLAYATTFLCILLLQLGGARGVMVIVTGYGHGDTSSIPGQDSLHFT